MATIKSYSDLEQSRKLAEILPIESADMYFEPSTGFCTEPSEVRVGDIKYAHPRSIPCWSLASLLSVLPDELTDSDGEVYRMEFFHLKRKYIIQYPKLSTLWPSLFSEKSDNPVDACVAMIEKLNELNLL